ncbi:hypothetical protein J6590_020573 [Homalodisca vitripennis]|nr:hypothetical protein J6590_020573 [Homalodisca vitripennis]
MPREAGVAAGQSLLPHSIVAICYSVIILCRSPARPRQQLAHSSRTITLLNFTDLSDRVTGLSCNLRKIGLLYAFRMGWYFFNLTVALHYMIFYQGFREKSKVIFTTVTINLSISLGEVDVSFAGTTLLTYTPPAVPHAPSSSPSEVVMNREATSVRPLPVRLACNECLRSHCGSGGRHRGHYQSSAWTEIDTIVSIVNLTIAILS